jgi:penicillin-binding protein 1C
MTRLRLTLTILLGLAALLAIATIAGLRPLPDSLAPDTDDVRRVQVRDRRGIPLSVTYENDWNLHEIVPLADIPPLLRQAFIMAEDRRFYEHHGPDWRARLHAAWQNLRAGRGVRGASTISEQAVRMLNPRPRTLWSRWLEGWEARALERRFSKGQILEFYLNQVPYSGRRRGVAQAARAWFDRDLSTLSPTEMLALAVMVRAPARLNPREGGEDLRRRLALLAERMEKAGPLAGLDPAELAAAPLELHSPSLPVSAGHFVRFLRSGAATVARANGGRLDTTIDASLQERVRTILDTRLHDLKGRDVGDGAVLVLDHRSGEILAWVNGGGDDPRVEGSMIDAILTQRQPGSTLKPLLYAAALDAGWSAATLIDDAPISGPVGAGLHAFRNYSRRFYGPLRLRDCLGNSLNTPAVRTIEKIGQQPFLDLLHRLGFSSLDRPAEFYGLGLALGNGEVTLLELSRAYAALAHAGVLRPLSAVLGAAPPTAPQRVFSAESASLIGDILSDPEARRLEFGRGSVLNLPLQTAVKTGTSTDYCDAWSVGFNHRYVVGVWMGNLDRRPMREVTGAAGPGLVLRSVFAELTRHEEGAPLYLSPRLAALTICRESGGLAGPGCPSLQEWFAPGVRPAPCSLHHGAPPPLPAGNAGSRPVLAQPTEGLQIAMDPRIPDQLEFFALELPEGLAPERTVWVVDGVEVGATGAGERRFLWSLWKGEHTALARFWPAAGAAPVETASVGFLVK